VHRTAWALLLIFCHAPICQRVNRNAQSEQGEVGQAASSGSGIRKIFSTMQATHLGQTLLGHVALCDAIAKGSFHQAYGAMRQHIVKGLDLQMAALTYSHRG